MSPTNTAVPAGYPKVQLVLPKNTAAIQISADANGAIRLGTLVQLPWGASVEITGDGFDQHTKRVFWEGSSYYVFLEPEELQPRRAWAQAG